MSKAPKLPSFKCKLVPFRALRFAPHKHADMADLIVPPRASVYMSPSEDDDTVGPPTVGRLFPHPRHMASEQWDPQDRASITRRYEAWRENGNLQWDTNAGIYVHRLRFSDPHLGEVERTGLYMVLAISPDGNVRLLPHEQTLPDRVKSQVEIFMWRGAQVLPLFGLYSDPNAEVLGSLSESLNQPPSMAFSDGLGQFNELWQITDSDLVDRTRAWFDSKEVVLADGHHRFEAARSYWSELRREGEDKTPGLNPEDHGAEAYAVMYLCPAEAPGLLMGTFHRGLKLSPSHTLNLAHRLGNTYRVEHLPLNMESDPIHAIDRELTLLAELRRKRDGHFPCFVIMTQEMDGLYVVTRRSPLPEETPATQRLDVSDLHTSLMPLLGPLEQVHFKQDAGLLVEALRRRQLDLACFLLPPTTDEVWDVARSRMPMPPKATNFYPKLPAGLLHFPLEHLVYRSDH